jgi:hypothetical protein
MATFAVGDGTEKERCDKPVCIDMSSVTLFTVANVVDSIAEAWVGNTFSALRRSYEDSNG